MELCLSSKKRLFARVSKEIKEDFIELDVLSDDVCGVQRKFAKEKMAAGCYKECAIEDYIVSENVPTFSKLVKKIMEEKGITTKDIYKNSLINRKLFSALNVNDDYVPSRETAIMYCIALRLDYDCSSDLLKSAGYSFYEYSNFDRIIKYFLDNEIFNINKINDALYCYTKKCLGYR